MEKLDLIYEELLALRKDLNAGISSLGSRVTACEADVGWMKGGVKVLLTAIVMTIVSVVGSFFKDKF